MIDYPVIIHDVLPKDYYFLLNDQLVSNWNLNNSSYDTGRLSWCIDYHLTSDLPFIACASFIKLKIQKILKRDLKLCKIHVNGQTSNQTSEFHKDFIDENVWTFILFCKYQWDISWGGEFVCFDEKNNQYKYCPFVPNTGCLIPSNWDHYGSCPNLSTDKLRVTTAFSYCDPLIYDKLSLKHQHLKMFY